MCRDGISAHCLKPSHQIRKFSLSTICPMMKRLLEWYHILEKLKLAKETLSHNAPTCWNSMFRMLNTANKYRAAVDKLNSGHFMELHQCELTNDEFVISRELRDILLVSDGCLSLMLTWSLARQYHGYTHRCPKADLDPDMLQPIPVYPWVFFQWVDCG
jgi:hypothetical protein